MVLMEGWFAEGLGFRVSLTDSFCKEGEGRHQLG